MSYYYCSQALLRSLGFALLLLDSPSYKQNRYRDEVVRRLGYSALTSQFPHLANGEMLSTPQR